MNNYYFLVVFLTTVVLLTQALDVDRYRKEVLAQHNTYRSQCSVEALQFNTTLNDIAQSWCGNLSISDDFKHSGAIEYGENSYKKNPWDPNNDNGATPVNAWYSERSKYTENNPEAALHFTQVVWKNTKTLGVGICTAKDGSVVFVANYYPRGNYKDQFTQNVLCKGSN